jgi:hypothetical protein
VREASPHWRCARCVHLDGDAALLATSLAEEKRPDTVEVIRLPTGALAIGVLDEQLPAQVR